MAVWLVVVGHRTAPVGVHGAVRGAVGVQPCVGVWWGQVRGAARRGAVTRAPRTPWPPATRTCTRIYGNDPCGVACQTAPCHLATYCLLPTYLSTDTSATVRRNDAG